MTNWNDAGELRYELTQLWAKFETVGCNMHEMTRMRRMRRHISRLTGISEAQIQRDVCNDAACMEVH
jgi:hypothetical protein